jgi:hypothetical protein
MIQCGINDLLIEQENGIGILLKVFGDLLQVSIQPYTEIRTFRPDLLCKKSTRHSNDLKAL